jgi:hypothetical protein
VSKHRLKDMAATVKARLIDLGRKQGEDFQWILTQYTIERLLYRLSNTPHANEFILKGAMLFRLWTDSPHRPTRDLDLLGRGAPSVDRLMEVFRMVCVASVVDDGLAFDPNTVTAGRIKEDQEYEGVRVGCIARLGQARIDLQIDVGFGDAVTPAPLLVRYPGLLDFPTPELSAYPKETVVAEKFQAMVALGIANSRMKDFFDVWVLARQYPFGGTELANAIRATFARRKTPVPVELPLALTTEFGSDAVKVTQWLAFLRKSQLDVGGAELTVVCRYLAIFLMPAAEAVTDGKTINSHWPPGGPWGAGN